MRVIILTVLLTMAALSSFAQPRYSPQVRSEREMKWLQDSVHISAEQSGKIAPISLAYQQQMDKAAESKSKKKLQQKLMRKKDSDMKGILNKHQYKQYYAREQLIRKREQVEYKGKYQPY